MVAARNALNSGLMRESTGMAEVRLKERVDSGLSQDLDDLVVILDPVSCRPAKLEYAWVDNRLGLLDIPASVVAPVASPVPTPPVPTPPQAVDAPASRCPSGRSACRLASSPT